MSNNLITQQVDKLASSFGLVPNPELYQVLKATAFKSKDGVSDDQLSALLIVANQYGLNPWTKEIYAYPDKNNGIVPVVGVDGWSRIINNNQMLDGISFTYSDETVTHKGKTCHVWIDCIIHRKDRQHPIVVRELFEEVVRNASFATPWDTHPNRMHRHKVLIQCARLAFGFGGIYDTDEAERIIEATPEKAIDPATGEIKTKAKELPRYTDEQFIANMNTWRRVIESGRKTVDEVLATIATIATLTEEQAQQIRKIENKTVDMETA
jgi:phage recombination protein Bet